MTAAVDILRCCGVELRDDSPPLLHTSTPLFRYKLAEALHSTPAATQQVTDLIDDLLAAHDDIALYLDPVNMAATEQDDQQQATSVSFAQQPESLVRLLLGVDALQPALIRTLLDKFPEFIGDQSAATGPGSLATAETKVSVKILRQLRWLDYIVDSSGLCEKLLETLGFVTPDMQCEIISNLPNIISDADNTEVSRVLAGMLGESPELMLHILETLGCLGCPPALLQDARNSVVTHLVSAEPMDLPVMIKFLLQSVPSDAAAPTIQRIRRRLDLDSIVLATRQQSRSVGGPQQQPQQKQAPDVLIFDVISTTLRGNKTLCDAWLKIITDGTDEETGTHTTLDIIVLLILHPMATYTRRVESVLRARFDLVSSSAVAYTPRLLRSMIRRFPDVFAANFGALLAVASWLVRSSPLGSQGARVAAAMLVAAFGHMGLFQRQEIAGELAVHIGSGNLDEIDTAAHICLELAQKHPWELRPFAIFIKGLLDYVDNLSIEHVRVIFASLGILATLNTMGSQDAGDDSMFSDLYIYVRKQLASVYPKYNRIGIVGTVSLLRQLGTKQAGPAVDVESQSQAGTSTSVVHGDGANVHALRRAVQLLEMLMDSGRHQSWAFISMTYDELAHVVETQGLHPQLLTWLHENVSSTFAAHFLCDAEQLAERYAGCDRPAPALSLDDDETAVLDIFNHSSDAADLGLHRAVKQSAASLGSPGATPKLRGCLLSCLPSLVRLIQVCEKSLGDGSLGDIDALLVCGIYLLPAVTTTAFATDHQPPQYAVADPNDPENDCSRLVAGNALANTDDDERRELVALMTTWAPELRRITCSSLYVAANWVREIINAFADQRAEEIRAKVLVRVDQLARIEACLATLAGSLSGTPLEFHPAEAGLVPEVSDTPALRTAPTTSAEGLGLRIAGSTDERTGVAGSSKGKQAAGSGGAVQTLEIGGLLLSQEDTRKLIGGSQADGAEADAGAPGDAARRRGRKRKSGPLGAGAIATDDFVRAPRHFLRELSFSAYGVLALGLDNPEGDQDKDGASVRPSRLTVHGLALVLRELHAVVSAKLVRHAEKRSGFPVKPANTPGLFGQLATFGSSISGCSADDLVAKHLLPLLPALLRHLSACLALRAHYANDITEEETELLAHIRSQRPTVSPIDSAQDVDVVERCIDALLQILSSVLYWDGLQNSTEEEERGASSVLIRVLGVVAGQNMHVDPEDISGMDSDSLVRCAFDHLLALAGLVATTARATLLLRMLIAVREYAPRCESAEEVCRMPSTQRQKTMDGQISRLAQQILSARFADSPDETRPADLEFTITTHILRCPHSRLRLAHTYAVNTLAGFFLESREEQAEELGVHAKLTHTTFATYYGATMGALAVAVKNAGFSEMPGHEALGFAARVAEGWLALTKLTQTIPLSLQRPVLKASLRGSLRLIDLFIKHILPVLDAHFFSLRADVLAVFSLVQKSTRILQNICNHSKVVKDVSLQASVPQVKRRLEQLVFQVVALMENNDCIGAINLGNLKHRDISGQVVSSQIPQSQRYSDEDEVEEGEGEEEEEEEEPMDLGLDRMLARETEEDAEEPPVQRRRTGRPPAPMTYAAGKKHALVVSRKKLLTQHREHRAHELRRKQRRRSRGEEEEEEDDDDGDNDDGRSENEEMEVVDSDRDD
ncbi:Fanconi anemia group D2 protein [Coemansia erecta]|uniref:Fanconi anemia group D2 protein n=1 Tax=Coemansia erecta TaxID=147472 RepID=A0A9W7XY46_9FUNG|nr:Fanconi anemia group D2 protein [Coemansia erecta]